MYPRLKKLWKWIEYVKIILKSLGTYNEEPRKPLKRSFISHRAYFLQKSKTL